MKSKKPYKWVEQPTVISAMRRAFRRFPPFKTVRDRCKVEWFQDCKNGNKRRRISFKCETCKEVVDAKNFTVDHTAPVIDPKIGFIDYNTYASRLFCDISNLSGMCKPCHNKKSKLEMAERAKTRKGRK